MSKYLTAKDFKEAQKVQMSEQEYLLGLCEDKRDKSIITEFIRAILGYKHKEKK